MRGPGEGAGDAGTRTPGGSPPREERPRLELLQLRPHLGLQQGGRVGLLLLWHNDQILILSFIQQDIRPIIYK